ncbi:hypothetical protein [Streptomyces radiopugnans]|uniref:Uncharacterized protein n=1 Tax=Streptomyces radiopugnans TaxID=403935 RepID=A0A1H9BMR1_9ACTN|nr:hypothetical protein [Streptomyces radiopugnans]SEP90226.1 hypothetical protein SAMN05216481_102484 [Streptomyces radiopugnans]
MAGARTKRLRKAREAEREVPLRNLELSEEVGETAHAVVGTAGQNPRKGIRTYPPGSRSGCR